MRHPGSFDFLIEAVAFVESASQYIKAKFEFSITDLQLLLSGEM